MQVGPEGLSLTGIPQFRQLNSGALPTATVLGGATMQVVYADPIDPSSAIVLPSQDPALRGPQGEYLAPQQVPVTPVGDPIAIGPDVSGTTRAALNPSIPLDQILLGASAGWRTVPTGLESVSWEKDSNNVYVEFGVDITGEVGLEHYSSWDQNISLAGGRIPLAVWNF